MKYLLAFIGLITLFDLKVNQVTPEVPKEEQGHDCHNCGKGVLILAEDHTMNCNACGIKVH